MHVRHVKMCPLHACSGSTVRLGSGPSWAGMAAHVKSEFPVTPSPARSSRGTPLGDDASARPGTESDVKTFILAQFNELCTQEESGNHSLPRTLHLGQLVHEVHNGSPGSFREALWPI